MKEHDGLRPAAVKVETNGIKNHVPETDSGAPSSPLSISRTFLLSLGFKVTLH
jgi:hypothetical protein